MDDAEHTLLDAAAISALNDASAGFLAFNDALVDRTGFSGSLANRAVV
ncbi:MAG: bluetail domain-containing putative surface protein [Cyanobacteriota bacterium]|nr:bluetail domain-containing putative surface protein [Cyanobacteriota bacterium]